MSAPDAAPRVGRRNMRDAADSRHACPCCSNDIRGRTVRRVRRCAQQAIKLAFIHRPGAAKPCVVAQPYAAAAAAAERSRCRTLRAETTWASARRTWWHTSWRKARLPRLLPRAGSCGGGTALADASHAGPWPADPFAALEVAVAGEAASLATLKALRFREGLDWEAAAARFGRGVTVTRLRGILRRDSLTIPLVQDAEPLEVRCCGRLKLRQASHVLTPFCSGHL